MWLSPEATDTTPVADTEAGVKRSTPTVAPSPTWLVLLPPQHRKVWSAITTHVWWKPDTTVPITVASAAATGAFPTSGVAPTSKATTAIHQRRAPPRMIYLRSARRSAVLPRRPC